MGEQTGAILFTALYCLVAGGALEGLRWRGVSVSTRSSMAVGAGVLGTFIGIVWTMLRISKDGASGTELIDAMFGGMTTAFVTSVAGLGYSLAIRGHQAWEQSGTPPEDDPYLIALQSIDTRLAHQGRELRRAIRSAHRTAASNNAALFREVLEDKLGQQFADLSTSIAALQTWQKTHGDDLTREQTVLSAIVGSLNTAAERIQEANGAANQRTAAIDDASSKLAKVLTDVRSFAVEANRLETIVELMAEAANSLVNTQSSWSASLEASSTALTHIGAIRAQAAELLGTEGKLVKAVDAATAAGVAKFTEHLEDADRVFARTIQLRNEKVDEELGQTLTVALNTFTGSLGRVSEKFASDYGPLADKLADVLTALAALEAAIEAERIRLAAPPVAAPPAPTSTSGSVS